MYFLSNAHDLIRFADDAQLRIRGLSTSVYVEPHKDSVVQWDDALGSVRAILESWMEVQVKWSHLAPLFGPSGLTGQLLLEVSKILGQLWGREGELSAALCAVGPHRCCSK